MVGWHHQLNRHGFGWTSGVGDGQGGLACYEIHGVAKSWTQLRDWSDLIQRVGGWGNVFNLISSRWWPETGTMKTIYLWKYQSPTKCCFQLLTTVLFLWQIMLSCSCHIISEFLWITILGFSSTLFSLYHPSKSKNCFFSLKGIAGHLSLPNCLKQRQAAMNVFPACAMLEYCVLMTLNCDGPHYPVRVHKRNPMFYSSLQPKHLVVHCVALHKCWKISWKFSNKFFGLLLQGFLCHYAYSKNLSL